MKIPFPKYEAETVAAIEEHLEQARNTEAMETDTLGQPEDGLIRTWSWGHRAYSRPMFEVLHTEASSSMRISHTPCPDCDDWSRTSRCETHHELRYNPDARKWEGKLTATRPGFAAIVEAYERGAASYRRGMRGHSRLVQLDEATWTFTYPVDTSE